MTTLTKKNNGQVQESLDAIKSRLKRNLAEMEQIVDRVTSPIRIAIGKDLIKARQLCELKNISFTGWLKDNFGLHESTAFRYISFADKHARSRVTPSITEHLREKNPNYAQPRQPVDEKPVRNILSGIDTKIFAERAKNEAKEGRLKKSMALELVDAGYRALSVKAHSDKGGSDDAMRRLSEVRKALKQAINDGDVAL